MDLTDDKQITKTMSSFLLIALKKLDVKPTKILH